MISVVINTYNAEKYLEEVLESVKQFDKIILCDMHSTDRTIDIAQNIIAQLYITNIPDMWNLPGNMQFRQLKVNGYL